MNKQLKQHARKEFDKRFLGKNHILFQMGLLNDNDIKDFIDLIIDRTVQHERERIENEIAEEQKKFLQGFSYRKD